MNASNFREIQCGNIAANTLYRSDHPICGDRQVKEIVISAKTAHIKTIINLSDDMRSLPSKTVCCPWYKRMIEEKNVIALNISMAFDVIGKDFTKKIKKGLQFMIEHEPPYLVHCVAGIDRTGLTAIILESLMNAPLDDIIKDYMLSYVDSDGYLLNSYKSGTAVVLNIFNKMKGEIIQPTENLHILSKKYLMEQAGLRDEEIKLLESKLARSENADC